MSIQTFVTIAPATPAFPAPLKLGITCLTGRLSLGPLVSPYFEVAVVTSLAVEVVLPLSQGAHGRT